MVLIHEADILMTELVLRHDIIKIIKALPKTVQYVVTTTSSLNMDFLKRFMKNVVIVNTMKFH